MSMSREEIVKEFQDFTGIKHNATAIAILNNNNWNLSMAVNNVMDNEHMNDNDNDNDVQMVESDFESVDKSSLSNLQKPSTSKSNNITQESTSKLITITVNHLGKKVVVELPESSTIGNLKRKLYLEFGILPSQQLFEGWPEPIKSDNTPLSEIKMPKNNRLDLYKSKITKNNFSNLRDKSKKRLYTLSIMDEDNQKSYTINYFGNTTVQKVKNDLYDLTDISVANQAWKGWPDNYSNESTLDQLKLSQPEHKLSVKSRRSLPARSNSAASCSSMSVNSEFKKMSKIIHAIESDDSDEFVIEEFDLPLCSQKPKNKREPLIPDEVEDEVIGCMHFNEQFLNRYGLIHPNFFIGSLEGAIKEACSKPINERKILAVYLHHDESVLANVFCSQLLACDAILQMLEENFIVWGWDVTFESNRNLILSSISERLGTAGFATIRTMPINRFPVIILIMQNRSSTEIHTVIYGDVNVNELSSRLIEAVDVFKSYQAKDSHEEEQRVARELVKLEQDMAFNESLQNDRAKEEAKSKKVELELEKQRQLAQELAEKQYKFEKEKKRAQSRLPAEPDKESNDIITIKIKAPNNDNLERRFHYHSPLNCLFDYLTIKGYPIYDYKVLLTWPKRDLTLFDLTKSFEELKLHKQECVILEER